MRGTYLIRSWIVAALLGAGGCGTLPSSGPSTGEILAKAADGGSLPYCLVRVTPEVQEVLATTAPAFVGAFTDRRPPREIRFGVGDVVSVSIFEAAAGGLFIPAEAGTRPGNFITLPNQNVDSRGFISVPYAGLVQAAGRTPAEVSQAIVEALRNRAIEPQAVVGLVDQRTSLVSVLGEVNQPARFPVNAAGERVLDAITRAGGPRGQGHETWVLLERNGRRATVPFGALVYEPVNNIFIQPNDTIFLYREPQTFLAFGASGQQGQFPFDAWRISLAEAVGKAGGLLDAQADPEAVFLYRGEPREVAAKFSPDCAAMPGAIVPVVYNITLKDPSGFFLATKVPMRNKDVVYVSNAGTVENAKLMQYIRLVTATVNDPLVAASNAVALRNAIKLAP